MGVFDESDDDDDEPAQAALVEAPKQQSDLLVEDDDDPLDAYMKRLDQQQQQQQQEQPPTRPVDSTEMHDDDDDDNEEDVNRSSNYALIHRSDLNDDDDSELWSSQKTAAKKALEATFRTAGSPRTDDTFTVSTPLHSKTATSTTPFPKQFWKGQDTTMGRNWRRDHQVVLSTNEKRRRRTEGIGCLVSGAANDTAATAAAVIMDPILTFQELTLVFGAALLDEIVQRQKFTTPTLVQSQTLPVALAGHDAIVTAATGQGKTLAYIWPVVVHVNHQTPLQPPLETGPLALVLVPTRELALQVQKQAKPMLAATARTSRAVIGGQGKYLLRQELKKAGVDVVIATPGRLLDVVSDRKGLSLQRVTMLVLDEADKMLQMGFEAQVRQILQQLRPDRQTLMLSATMGLRVEKVAAEWLTTTGPTVRIAVGRTGEASSNVEQHVMVLPTESAKETFLLEMLPTLSQVGRTVVFVATREKCERLATVVRERTVDLAVLTLHGDKHQSDRTAAVRAFTKGDVKVLIATDVAARGLDIPNIQTVLSYDPAKNLDSHVHRVGRAGRLSKETNEQQVGSAYTLLLTPNHADFAHILSNALEREGRSVSPELVQLAQRSRRRSARTEDTVRTKQAGLGFAPAATHMEYSSAPLVKRGRWT